MSYRVDLLPTLLVALIILFTGFYAVSRIPLLRNYNIPVPVVGGIAFAVVTAVLHTQFDIQIAFDEGLKTPLMLAFFATVGLTADFRRLRAGGLNLALFLLVVSGFLLVQNTIGTLAAISLDLHPVIGLLGGSITLSGGHGTGAAYAERFGGIQNIQGAMEIAMASATFGLVIGGLIGGPVAQWLIARHRLVSQQEAVAAETGLETPVPSQGQLRGFLETLFLIVVCLACGQFVYGLLSDSSVTLPAFIWALFTGVLIRNFFELTGIYRIHDQTLDILGTVALSLFLAMAFMSLRLWELLDLAGPLLAILAVQTAAMVLYAITVTYRVMGSNYDAAVMVAGHCGFGMGATPTAVANMEALTLRYGPSPQAFLVIPMVGAFFIDIVNATVIQGFLALPFHGF